MKKYLGISLAVLAMSSTSLLAGTIGWGIDTSGGTYSDGTAVPTGYTFELGAFAGGFSPGAGNTAQWSANFLTSGIDTNTATWANLGNSAFPTFGEASGSSIFRPGGAVAQGDQAFIWGYNSVDVAGTSQWILLTNSSWVFPAPTPTGGVALPAGSWFATDAGTTMVFGSSFNLAGNQDTLTREFQTAQAIPEPSTYALIFGLGILGFLGFRRFRK